MQERQAKTPSADWDPASEGPDEPPVRPLSQEESPYVPADDIPKSDLEERLMQEAREGAERLGISVADYIARIGVLPALPRAPGRKKRGLRF